MDDILEQIANLILGLRPRLSNSKKLGARIRYMRTERGMIQDQLADCGHGFNRSYISNLELGRHECSLESLRAIAGKLDTTCAYLLGENQNWFYLTDEEKKIILTLRILKSKGVVIY